MESYGGGHAWMAPNVKPMVFDPKYMIPDEVVDDVICRFLLNIPKEEKFDSVRVCFQIELAHWFFVDYYCGEGCDPALAHLQSIPYNQFAYIMFQKTPHLRPRLKEIDKHLAAFREYKMRVPTYGAILMNQNLTKVVLVQGFRNQWGFPKGKVNEVEDPVSCAIREVFEETGYDIGSLVNKNHFIESKTLERNDRLYLVRGVELNFPFQPQTQFEIKNIKWFNISELPEHKRDSNPAIANHGVPISNFYTVYPYVKRLKTWIADKVEGKNKIQNFKVRMENENTENQSSNQRNPTKSQGQIKSQQKLPPNVFHFNQNFLQGATAGVGPSGWQLFPAPTSASSAGDQKPYVLNSNALHELILGQSQLQVQNQSRQVASNTSNTTNNKSSSKNPRRRLFSEDVQTGGSGTLNQQITNITSNPQQRATESYLNIIVGSGSGVFNSSFVNLGQDSLDTSRKVKSAQNIFNQNKNSSLAINSPSWVNFTFDRERLYKAFFTPNSNH